ncbi:MAG TPA: SRPBCC domain-containing protein [Gemmatimonadales bacterium]|nr:SRPBCC domain-containing protein [Gemmatimonadales bacterium]
MSVTDNAPVLVVRKQIAVPRERVFAAWLDSESLAQWMRPRSFGNSVVVVDARVGGSYRISMVGPDRMVEHWGEYLAIEPPSLLRFTWASPSTDEQATEVTVEFFEKGSGTELVLTHRGLPQKAVEGHRKGWTEILGLLGEVVEGE